MRRGKQCAEKVCGEAQRRVAGTTVPPGRVFLSAMIDFAGLDPTIHHPRFRHGNSMGTVNKIHAEIMSAYLALQNIRR